MVHHDCKDSLNCRDLSARRIRPHKGDIAIFWRGFRNLNELNSLGRPSLSYPVCSLYQKFCNVPFLALECHFWRGRGDSGRVLTQPGEAEGVGFEPTDSLHCQRFSRPSRSTTLAPLPWEERGRQRTNHTTHGTWAVDLPLTCRNEPRGHGGGPNGRMIKIKSRSKITTRIKSTIRIEIRPR